MNKNNHHDGSYAEKNKTNGAQLVQNGLEIIRNG